MTRLTEDMVCGRTRQEVVNVKKLNCWGSDLEDVSIVRKMKNVEVLALSLNKISTLVDFEECWSLQELYLRKNNITDLSELCYLQNLPNLRSLWLDENPCALEPNYRYTVIRALPKLKTLDNTPVKPEELADAPIKGRDIFDDKPIEIDTDVEPDDDEVCQPSPIIQPSQQIMKSYSKEDPPRQDPPKSPRKSRNVSYSGASELSPPQSLKSSPSPKSFNGTPESSPNEAHSRSMRHKNDNVDVSLQQNVQNWVETRPDLGRGEGRINDITRKGIPNIMSNFKGFGRKPMARNSNLLSAVLCLIKELDIQNLEVLELAVRCRMDELSE